MKVLLSTIGSRGEVQPLLGLALELRTLGHQATVVAPPNFGPWIVDFGVPFVPLGPDVRNLPPRPPGLALAPMEVRRKMVAGTVQAQLEVLSAAAPGHDVILGAGTLQLVARSIAEARDLRYVFAGYCPLVMPSRSHPPVKMGEHHALSLSAAENSALWAEEEAHWDDLFGPAVNDARAALGLPAIDHVLAHLLTDRPWMAVDPILGPAPTDRVVVQTGAWRLTDPTPLPAEVERFLDLGDPPVFLGLGSNQADPAVGHTLLQAARAVGRRAILSRGWAGLSAEAAPDWIAVGDLDHDALFPRVAAVVHHGGAGTTTTCAVAGRVQVVLPHHYDQHYWGHRVEALGIGVAATVPRPVPQGVVQALLEAALHPDRVARAAALAPRIVRDGSRIAAVLAAGRADRRHEA